MQKQLIGNRYRIKDLIGEGGMAFVYAALDEKLNRQVAIKILHPHLSRNADLRERFLFEARTLSTFDHPNIIKVFDFSGLDSEQLWMVTEILHGVDLAEYIKRLPKFRMHPLIASLIVREVCRALQEVHKLKIVHRDIKPENIMLLDNGHIRLMDFGIAKVNRDNATQTGTFMGSPSYMSPEQIRGTDVDIRADIYSLCVLYYEIITGTLPFLGDTTAEVINKIIVGSYSAPHILLPEIPAKVHSIITQGMHGQPAHRFQSMQEMMNEIDEYLSVAGFGDSRLELERYFRQRLMFEQRLAASDISKKTQLYSPLSKPRADPPPHLAQTEVLTAASSRSEGDFSSLATSTPRLEFEDHDGTANSLVEQPSTSQELPQQRQTLPQSVSKMPPAPSAAANELSKQRFRASSPKIFIREYRADLPSRHQRSDDSTSSYVLAGLIAVIAIIAFLGWDRIESRIGRDVSKVIQNQPDNGSKKKRPAPPRTPDDKPELPSPSAPPPIVVDSQTVVIDGNSKNPPQVIKRDISTPRTARSISSSLKTLPSASSPAPSLSSPPRRGDTVAVIKRPPPSNPDLSSISSPSERSPAGTDNIPMEGLSDRGILKISSIPASEIYIDGRMYGVSNDRDLIQNGLKLEAGSYVLRFKRKGYKQEEYAVQIRPGEVKQLSISLNKLMELVELTVRANKLPSRVVIEDVRDGGRRRDFTLTKTLVLNLRPGTYRVAVSNGTDTINRLIELGENEKSLTFNAEFR